MLNLLLMHQRKPVVYLLCGLPGSGKTTYAKKLEDNNTIRFTLDEELFAEYGKKFLPISTQYMNSK